VYGQSKDVGEHFRRRRLWSLLTCIAEYDADPTYAGDVFTFTDLEVCY
jgi:hypothetical protein